MAFAPEISRAMSLLKEKLDIGAVIALDVEAVPPKDSAICLMAFLIETNGDYDLHFNTLNGPPSWERTMQMENRFERWVLDYLDRRRPGIKIMILTHGHQASEDRVLERLKERTAVTVVNTQECLHDLLRQLAQPQSVSKTPGLSMFESLPNIRHRFVRTACGFYKHLREKRDFGPAFFHFCTTRSCLDLAAGRHPPCQCGICHKPQDVYLYCLEDALSSFLIKINSVHASSYLVVVCVSAT